MKDRTLGALLIVACGTFTHDAFARPDLSGLHGGLRFDEHVAWRTSRSREANGDIAAIGTAGSSLRALGGGDVLAFAVGVDIEIGASWPLGFAYETTLYPLGTGLFFGRSGFFSVVAGVGVSGVTAHVPATFRLPIEAFFDLDLAGDVHVAIFSRASLLAHGRSRGDGALHAPFGDELTIGLAFSFHAPRSIDDHRYAHPHDVSGPYAGAIRREALGTYELGSALGWMTSLQM